MNNSFVMSNRATINRIDPPAGIPGGEIAIDFTVPAGRAHGDLRVLVDEAEAHLVAVSKHRTLALLPKLATDGDVAVSINFADDDATLAGVSRFLAGKKLADGLHPVANPAFDPADGSLFVTRSGARGEHVPVSLYRIASDGSVEEFSGDIANPTAIAFDRRGQMFVTSRMDGTVYRVSPVKESAVFAGDLGIATGPHSIAKARCL